MIDFAVNSMYPSTFTQKYPMNEWRFDFNPNRERWETYRNPKDWPFDLYQWLWSSFGHPGTDPITGEYSGWDYHGGWIYIYKEEVLLMFKLKWS